MSRPLRRSRSSFLVALLAISLLGACRGPLKPGLDALAEGNYEKAEKQARSGLVKDRNDPRLNLLMADALVGEQRYKEALRYARRAYESPELRGPAGRTLGKVLWELDETVESLRVWRATREVDASLVPDDDYVRALERAIEVTEKDADPETELEFRRELLSVRADHPEASDAQIFATRERLAETLVREGNYEAAITVYEELSTERRDNATYPFERGRLLARLGEDARSITAFDEFIAIGDADSRHQRIHDVAVRAETIGAFSVAVHFYEEAIAALPDEPSRQRARIHRRVGGLLLSTGIKDSGERHLRAFVDDMRAVGGEPVSAEIYISAATVATGNRHPDFALELLEEASAKAAPSWRATRQLAELYARRARAPDTERVLRTYVERAGNTSSAKVVVGEWAANRRNFELARFFLESAVNEDGDVSADVWLQLARVYSALGYIDEVRRSLKSYTSKAPDKRRALLDVAAIYRAQRMYDEAESSLEQALKSEPGDLLVVKLLEDLYREWGRPKKVHEVYDRWAKARGNKPGDFQLIGERFFRKQEWDNALPYLTRAARAGEHEAWLQVADIYNRQRKERDMKDALDKYLETSTSRARALNSVLQRYRVSNWNHEAIPILEELITLEPRNLLHYEQLSQLYFEQGRDVEAFELWKRFISLSDNPIAALETMARRFQRRQHQDWMLQFLHQVLEREEKPDPRIYRLLGDTYADLWAAHQQRQGASDAIFTQENKAKQYYARYLDEAKPSRSDLQTFAESMRQKRFWTIAARAYDELAEMQPLQAHQLLNYGVVLLNLGQAARAEAVFADFYDKRQKSVDAAMAISEHLYSARRYQSVEPYLRAMLQNGDDALVRQAFMRLAEVYRNSDQRDKIPGLIAEFLNQAQDPQDARRTVQSMLEAAGMWEEAAQQLETIAELQEEAGFELGQNLYRAGQRDRADDAFRDYAAQNLNPGEAWSRVGGFYEARGEVEKARNAYQNAANAAPQSEVAHGELGRYLILIGQVDEGRRAMERARSNVPHGQRGNLFRTEVEALINTGNLGEAREAARDAIAVAFLDRDYFYGVIAPVELDSGDPVRSQRMVDELVGANLPLGATVRLLRNAGYLEEAAALIDKEITTGDHILGGDVLLSNAEMFGALGGIGRLMRSAQPLLERTNRDARVPRELGRFLVAEGHVAQGAMLMRQALELGDMSLASVLAGIYASLGHHTEAFEMLQAELAAASDGSQRELALTMLGYRYELLGEHERFRNLLGHLARDDRFAAEAIPLLLRYLTEDGEIALVVDTVERLIAPGISDDESTGDDRNVDIAVAALTAGVEELAIAGFEREALNLLTTAPAILAERDQIRDVRLRMAAFASGGDPAVEFDRALAELGDSSSEAWQRLRVAELALAAGRYDLANSIADPAIESTDFNVSARALRIVLRSARAADDLEKVDATIERYLTVNPDRMGARSSAQSELVQLGLDRRALLLAEDQATRVPIYSNVREAFMASQRFGDPVRIKKWANRLLEVDRQNPNVTLGHNHYQWTLRQDDSLNEPLRQALAGSYDQMFYGYTSEVRNLYRRGDPFTARDRIRAYLERVSFDPSSVEQTLLLLSRDKLWGEVARVVAPLVPEGGLTITSQRMIGLANMSIGFDSEGLRILDKTIQAAPDAAVEAASIADELLYRRRYDSALRYAELSVERRPNRPDGRRVRGLARLAVGDLAGANEDLEVALHAGLNRNLLLHRAAIVALRNGHDSVAERFLSQLLVGHSDTPESATRRVVDAYQRTDKASEGVKFLETQRPGFAAGHGIAGANIVPSLSQLYESADMDERSFQVYEEGIRRLQFTDPLSGELATYHNNLAYGYSTTNTNIERGLDLVRRAIAQHPSRQASYIDTLGWLHYREGDLKLAEEEVRRALRSSTGSPGELTELYEHLAVLRSAQGYDGEAVWFQIFAESVDLMTD